MQFRVLGAVEFRTDGAWRQPRGRLRQRLLATLLARAGRTTTHHDLAVALWGESDGPAPVSRLHLQVHRLRRELSGGAATTEDNAVISAVDDGYVLRVGPEAVDALRFEDRARTALAAADDDPVRRDAAARALQEWPEPWRGRAYDGIDAHTCLDEASRLHELRIDVAEAWFAAELSWGRQLDILGDLRTLAAAEPMRESVQVLLMRALHQAGRRHEALEVYRRCRTLLVDELGLEPGEDLRAQQAMVLASGGPASTPTRSRIPAQLPPAPDLIGRSADLTALDRALQQRGGPCVLTGPPGVGKTAVALSWAHRHREDFPDGQLFVDLRGFSPDPPASPDAVLDGFIRALGGDPTDLVDTAERTAVYRSLAAEGRFLIVLDNARSPGQVRPLLPGAPGCRVLVTSRDRLDGLQARDHAVRVDLERLTAADALTILRGTKPHPDGPDEQRWRTLARRCDHLPLLLRIAAERIRTDPDDLPYLIGELPTEHPLDLLDFGDAATSARSLFLWSYRALPETAATVLRTLGVIPAPTVDVRTVAAAAGLDPRATRRGVDQLVRAHLVINERGWLRQHDLVAAFARERAGADLADEDRDAVLTRAVEHCHDALIEAELRWRRPQAITAEHTIFPGVDEALAWRDRAPALVVALSLAASPSADRAVAGLYSEMYLLVVNSGHRDQLQPFGDRALVAAERAGDPILLGTTLTARGAALRQLGERAAALASFDRALEILPATASAAIVRTHNDFGSALETFGDLAGAVDQYRLALDVLHRDPPTAPGSLRRREAILYGNLADVLHQLGDLSAADDYGRQALDRATDAEGNVTLFGPSVVLAEVALERGEPAKAIAFAEPARAAADRFGDRLKQCETEIVLARAHWSAGDRGRAEALLGDALDRAEGYGFPEQTAGALWWLGQVIAEDDPVRAQLLVERATAIARRAGFNLPVAAS